MCEFLWLHVQLLMMSFLSKCCNLILCRAKTVATYATYPLIIAKVRMQALQGKVSRADKGMLEIIGCVLEHRYLSCVSLPPCDPISSHGICARFGLWVQGCVPGRRDCWPVQGHHGPTVQGGVVFGAYVHGSFFYACD